MQIILTHPVDLEKDTGQSDAMNKGIAMAKGGIIAILNG